MRKIERSAAIPVSGARRWRSWTPPENFHTTARKMFFSGMPLHAAWVASRAPILEADKGREKGKGQGKGIVGGAPGGEWAFVMEEMVWLKE